MVAMMGLGHRLRTARVMALVGPSDLAEDGQAAACLARAGLVVLDPGTAGGGALAAAWAALPGAAAATVGTGDSLSSPPGMSGTAGLTGRAGPLLGVRVISSAARSLAGDVLPDAVLDATPADQAAGWPHRWALRGVSCQTAAALDQALADPAVSFVLASLPWPDGGLPPALLGGGPGQAGTPVFVQVAEPDQARAALAAGVRRLAVRGADPALLAEADRATGQAWQAASPLGQPLAQRRGILARLARWLPGAAS